MVVHCLFEQSGAFKNAFRDFGYEAYDYDIENQFSQTDFQIDLFTRTSFALNCDSSILLPFAS